MLAVSSLSAGWPAKLPNLKLVQKLGAGVETIVRHPSLAEHVRVTRLKPVLPAQEIAEWFLTYVLMRQRNTAFHAAEQAKSAWTPREPALPENTTVGVLGLGHIGGLTARTFAGLGYRVQGWSRSPKEIAGVSCHHGADALETVLAGSDYVCAILPATEETRGLMGADRLAQMKPGAMLLNAGRGDLIDEAALCQALDHGTPGEAVLDVVSQEPLPAESPLWQHPNVTITPHISGWHLGDALKDVAENLRLLTGGKDLLHEVDRARGY
jgi:glyoxylate/hydroxypyruvate reductase A